MKQPALAAAVAFALVAVHQGVFAQAQPRTRSGTLVIAGDVAQPATWKVAELKTLPRTSVTATSEDGRKLTYEGVLVGELLKRAGVISGPEPRGPALTTYVLAAANDGYQVLFSLAELDSAFSGHDVIVADTVDGKPLADSQGPLRIVPPRDTRGARSVRMLERLEVVRLRK